jgi:hypothetical protein
VTQDSSRFAEKEGMASRGVMRMNSENPYQNLHADLNMDAKAASFFLFSRCTFRPSEEMCLACSGTKINFAEK